MSDINLQEVKKLVRTKKDKSDFESLKLFLEARDSGDFSKWQNFILKRANRNNRKDLKKNHPVKYYFTWLCRIFLFPLWIVIVIDSGIKFFKRRKTNFRRF